MSIALSKLNTRVGVFETQYEISSCMFSTFNNNGGIYTFRVGGTKITIPSTGNLRLIWKLNQLGCHTGTGGSTDYVYAYMFVRNETTSPATVVGQTTEIRGGRGAPTLQNDTTITFEGVAGNTYQLYLGVRVQSDDHAVAFFNGGTLWVLPPSQTTAPTSGYLFYN